MSEKKWLTGVLAALVFLSAAFSFLSVVGLPATIPLGGAGGCFALVSSGLIIASKKLDSIKTEIVASDCYTCYRKTRHC